MHHKLLKVIAPLVCVGVLAAVPAAAGAVTVGISDQTTTMFSSPLFTGIHIQQARLLVSWNVAVDKRYRSELKNDAAWIKAAQADGVQPLIDFQADPGSAGNYVPSLSVYTAAVKAFIKQFPTVTQYIPWNEPDWNYRSLSRNPGLAAAYFNALHQACSGCSIIAGDLYLDAGHLGSWIKAYKKGLHSTPAAWALHPYNDIQGHSTAQIQTMMRFTTGPIWLTEISGVVRRGHWHGGLLTQTLAKQATDESFLFSLPSRFPRIARIYHYQWLGEVATKNTGWDSGLLNPNGTPRPAYYVVANAAK
jgi:hypothetical protein